VSNVLKRTEKKLDVATEMHVCGIFERGGALLCLLGVLMKLRTFHLRQCAREEVYLKHIRAFSYWNFGIRLTTLRTSVFLN